MQRNNRGKPLARSLLIAGLIAVSAPAAAQDLVHTFKDPSFGGNPFNSEHLLAIAGFDRPEQRTEATSPEDLLASQLRAQLTSSLSSSILTTIQTAKPGDTGSFTVGSQIISFTRTATETTVTFTNTRTGEVSTLVIPVAKTTTPSPFGASPSGESALIGVSALARPSPLVDGGEAGLEVPLGPPPL